MYAFQSSFWSPTASIDPYPNFRYGFDVLHKKLTHSLDENKTIVQYIGQRIESERTYANTLNKLYRPKDEEEAMTGLTRCFQVVCAESEASAKEHVARADNLHTTALDPLQRFSTRYSQRLSGTRQHIRSQLGRFESLVKQLEAAKSNYDSKCKSLMVSQPNYRLNVIKLGTRVFHDRFWIDDWIKTMPTDRSGITDWLEAEHQEPTVLHDLIGLNFVRQTAQDRFEKVLVSQPKTFSGFFKQQDMEKEMLVADKIYKDLVWQVDQMRTRIEQELLLHYEEMEKLELERIETLKQVFISLAASLSNTIPRYKETVDNMMLYQETLVPDKDVQTIVEQHRTGQFCPRPILYENYFYGTAHHQLFGVSLSEITRTEGTIVPNFITKALSMIETVQEDYWSTGLALDKVHAVRKEMNQQYPQVTFQGYDIPLVVSLVKLYLMELPDCLLTFELYEPCKSIYSHPEHQDKDICRTLFSHLHKLNTPSSPSLSHILLRPQTESKVSTFERHPHRLVQDLICHFPDIFTKETDHSNRDDARRSRHLLAI
ncbi:unnamed protein product [Rhizopus stolonifer]